MACIFCRGDAYAQHSGDGKAKLEGDVLHIDTSFGEVIEDAMRDAGYEDEVDEGVGMNISMRINYCPYCGDAVWRGTEPWTGWYAGKRRES